MEGHSQCIFGSQMRRRIRQTTSLALLALLSLVAGCTKDPGDRGDADKRPLVLGVSAIVSWGNWNGPNAESIRSAARDAGIELHWDDARHSKEKQVATLRSFARQRVGVIAFSPVVETGWEFVLREIRSAGIPVILMDRSIEVSDESLYVSMIGSDFVEEGRRAGGWLIENTRDVSGDVDIVELQGTLDSSPTNGRSKGFGESIAAHPRYRVIRSRNADYDLARARDVMAELLKTEGRRIRVVFAHNDSMALGAIEAIEAAGLKPGSDILLIGIEGSRKGLEAIVAGKMNVSVECSPLLGPQLIAVVQDVAAGKQVPRRVVTQESVFTRENAAAELPDRPY
jgi:galactofuranose transport system substrate-binding protein